MEPFDVTVLGAGVVGLACGALLARKNLRTVVLEQHTRAGTETTSRNSQVIHAGLYYPAGSRKAALCVRGAELLYAYCKQRNVAHRVTGKFVVAESREQSALEALHARATANGAHTRLVDGAHVRSLEPHVRCDVAMESPHSGIVDAHGLTMALAADLAARDGVLALAHRVIASESNDHGHIVVCEGPAGTERIASRVVVNASGLASDRVASMFGVDVDAAGYRQHFVKGNYFRVRGAPLVTRLVYPMPPTDLAGLGIHATVELDGSVRLGPDTEDASDYRVDEGRRTAFHRAASRYLETLREDQLEPDTAGVRPKVASGDFIVESPLAGFVHLGGIESPGLTAALAIAEQVLGLCA